MSYRWAYPLQWLEWAYDNDRVDESDLMNFIRSIADSDQIQDHFQADMDADGYFNENWDEEEQEYADPEERLAESTKEAAVSGCYYGDPEVCDGELWTCRSCLTVYCDEHFHDTELGHNVECVVCERNRLDKEKDIE